MGSPDTDFVHSTHKPKKICPLFIETNLLACVSARCDSVSSGYRPGECRGAASGGDRWQHPEHPVYPWWSTVGHPTQRSGRLALWHCQNTRRKKKPGKSMLCFFVLVITTAKATYNTILWLSVQLFHKQLFNGKSMELNHSNKAAYQTTDSSQPDVSVLVLFREFQVQIIVTFSALRWVIKTWPHLWWRYCRFDDWQKLQVVLLLFSCLLLLTVWSLSLIFPISFRVRGESVERRYSAGSCSFFSTLL